MSVGFEDLDVLRVHYPGDHVCLPLIESEVSGMGIVLDLGKVGVNVSEVMGDTPESVGGFDVLGECPSLCKG